MKKEEPGCDLCHATIDEACNRYSGVFCDLKTRFETDPTFGNDELILSLTEIMTPEQREEVAQAMIHQGKLTR